MSRDSATILDIVKASRRILTFTNGVDRSAFDGNLEKQSAVIHQVTILGEAVKRLSAEFRARHPAVAWQDIAGMRDVLIHDYDNVVLDDVWEAVILDVPRLLAYVEPLARSEEA